MSGPLQDPANSSETRIHAEERAIGTFRDALAYIDAAGILVETTKSSPVYAAPVYFLVSQAIELLLKAFLVSHGADPRELSRHHVRHNLADLLRRASESGFVPYDDRFPAVVELLSPFHEAHSFRYRKLSSIVPAQSTAAEIVSITARGISQLLRARYLAAHDEPDTVPMVSPTRLPRGRETLLEDAEHRHSDGADPLVD